MDTRVSLKEAISDAVATALKEDLQSQNVADDITTSLITAVDDIDKSGGMVQMSVRLNEKALLCGCAWFEECFRQLEASLPAPGPADAHAAHEAHDPQRVKIRWLVKEGTPLDPCDVCVVAGDLRVILAAERSAINFLQTLSGTATHASRYARLADREGYAGILLDTRKTLPGLRAAQKYAVRVGGCENHRFGLYDAVFIKENHIIASGGDVAGLIKKAGRQFPDKPIILETENLTEFKAALAYPADVILLDNFSVADVGEAIKIKQASNSKVLLEVSGVKNEQELIAMMKLQPDRISLGDLTKHLTAIDFSARLLKS